MRRLTSFVFGVLVGGALVFFGQRYHVLRTVKGVELVPKLSSGFTDTYVDVRTFQSNDWTNHKALAAAILQAKKDYIFTEPAAADVRKGVGGVVDQLKSLRDS